MLRYARKKTLIMQMSAMASMLVARLAVPRNVVNRNRQWKRAHMRPIEAVCACGGGTARIARQIPCRYL